MNERVRIEVGFEGGGVLSAMTPAGLIEELERALASNAEGAFALETEDGRYTVVLRKIVYVKRFAREGRVGFGAA
jgi:hypothetical protein